MTIRALRLSCIAAVAVLCLAVPAVFIVAPVSAQILASNYATDVEVIGDAVLVGEPDNHYRPGTVYVYRRTTANEWAESERLTASDAQLFDGFGSSISIDRDLLAVGALRQNGGSGAAYVFAREDGAWVQRARLTADASDAADRFGAAIAISGDIIAVGAPATTRYGALTPATRPGSVFVFERRAGEWSLAARLNGSDADIGAAFGYSVAITGDEIFVGAPQQERRAGAVYVFSRGEDGWEQTGVLRTGEDVPGARLGYALLAHDGAIYAGAPGTSGSDGSVVVYERNADAGTWSMSRSLRPFDGESSGFFGASLGAAGSSVWIGAPYAQGGRGDVYRIDVGDSASSERLHVGTVAGGQLGAAVAAAEDLVVAAVPKGDGLEGTALVIARSDGRWVADATLRGDMIGLDRVTGEMVRCTSGEAAGFGCSGVDLVAFMPLNEIGGGRGVRANDIWGWTDPETNREYVLLGRTDGTSFVDVTAPSQPIYIGDLPLTPGAIPTVWRDIKVYKNHAFIVADNTPDHGMQVFDLTRLRDLSGTPVTFAPDTVYLGIQDAHNVAINEETGYAFAVGSNTCGGGLHMVDIRDPKNPTFAGCFSHTNTGSGGAGYTHDTQCVTYDGPDSDYRGREICFSSNGIALSIADVTDKGSPKPVSLTSYPDFAYVHQGWLTEDHRYFYLNDELDEYVGNTPETRTLIWDVSDLADPQLVTEYTFGTQAADHNLYVRGNYMYQSNYLSGLRIHDITDPVNPREVAYFDTVPVGPNDSRLDGSWSNYPYFESGTIAVSSKEEGLFLVRMADEPGL